MIVLHAIIGFSEKQLYGYKYICMRVFYFKGFYALSHLRSDINVHWILFFKVVGNGICQMRNFWKFSYFPKSADGCI